MLYVHIFYLIFFQTVTEPNHYTSFIELIFVSNKKSLKASGIAEPFLNQEFRCHCQVFFFLKYTKLKDGLAVIETEV